MVSAYEGRFSIRLFLVTGNFYRRNFLIHTI